MEWQEPSFLAASTAAMMKTAIPAGFSLQRSKSMDLCTCCSVSFLWLFSFSWVKRALILGLPYQKPPDAEGFEYFCVHGVWFFKIFDDNLLSTTIRTLRSGSSRTAALSFLVWACHTSLQPVWQDSDSAVFAEKLYAMVLSFWIIGNIIFHLFRHLSADYILRNLDIRGVCFPEGQVDADFFWRPHLILRSRSGSSKAAGSRWW